MTRWGSLQTPSRINGEGHGEGREEEGREWKEMEGREWVGYLANAAQLLIPESEYWNIEYYLQLDTCVHLPPYLV